METIQQKGTTEKQANKIIELLNINSEKKMESKYQKYIDLLKANKNLILTGAPGTGKTYMAKGIAQGEHGLRDASPFCMAGSDG